jgi:hypothetical protein
MNPVRRGRKRVGGRPQIPREERGEDRHHIQRDQPHRQIHCEKVREERNAAALFSGQFFHARRDGVPVFLHEVQMEHEHWQKEQRQHHHMQSEEALYGRFTYFRDRRGSMP